MVAERVQQMKSESIVILPEVFNLNSYETNSYLALLKKDSLTAAEVAKISGVPRGRIYEILNNLLEKGFCHSIPGKVKKYKASNPDFLHGMIKSKFRLYETEIEKETKEFDADVEKRKKEFSAEIERRRREFESEVEKRKHKFDLEIERKKQKINSGIERKKQELHLLEKKNDGIVEKLTDVYKKSRGNGDPLDYFEVLRNPIKIHHRYLQLCSEAKNEILGFIKPPFAFSGVEQKKEQGQVNIEIAQRGVKLRGIHEIPADSKEREEYFSHLRKTIKPDAETARFIGELPLIAKFKDKPPITARFIDKLPMKLFVFDNSTTMFTLEDPIEGKLSLTMFVVKHKVMAESFKAFFESFWEKAKDYCIIDGKKVYLAETSKKSSQDKEE